MAISLSQLSSARWLIPLAVASCCLAAPQFTGSARCLSCHPAIGQSYGTTAMARTSGKLETALLAGRVRHKASGTRFVLDGQTVRFGKQWRTLRYFVGSGAAGRSFFTQQDGFLFLAPLTWYAATGQWDMSPGYETAQQNLWNRPIEPNCLFCHSTRPQPIHGTQNRYADPPFVEPGIGCERCHGPGSEHAASGSGAIVNPARLDATEREDICAQCHLTGEARIDRPGRQLAMYRPGDRLADYVTVFVGTDAASGRFRVTSHMEKLSYSKCRQGAGSRLWCGSCHDAHRVPEPAERAAWFRGKCLDCHGGKLAGEHAARVNCVECHMPRAKAADANHGVFTDHSIPRLPQTPREKQRGGGALVAARGFVADDRSLGLAYAEAALESNDPWQRGEALRLLRQALPAAGNDWDLLTRLAYLEEPAMALALYERSLQVRPNQPVALVNAALLRAAQGKLDTAISYWKRALAVNPGLTEASRNLATALRAQGRGEEARQVLRQAARYEPGVDQ